jgi:hypothetical protein
MEMMIELMHPTRLEKKANIRNNRHWSGMWPDLSQAAALSAPTRSGLGQIKAGCLAPLLWAFAALGHRV